MIRISLTIAPPLRCLIASAALSIIRVSSLIMKISSLSIEFCAYTFPINLSSIFCKN